MAEALTGNIALLRDFFGKGKHGRKLELSEIKALSKADRDELVELIKENAGIVE